MDIFVEVSIIMLLVTGVSFVMKLLRQPFIVGYILTGILVGPYFFNILHSTDSLEFFSKFGITILLFIVGLGLNPKVLKEVGKISLVTGLGQVVFTSVVGYLITRLIGFDNLSSIYVAIALTFSSTIIVLKHITDKGDSETLYGKISVGLLLVQDIIASLILIALSSFALSGNDSMEVFLVLLLLKAIGVVALLILMSKAVLPKVLEFVAATQELLFLFSIAWGMVLAAVFYKLGFSVEIGALVAGISISSTPYASEIGSRLKPLRDFFVLVFFILLGSQMVLDTLPQILIPSLVLSLFVLIGKPIIVIVIMNMLGYKRKTVFMAGLTVAQVSEFSLILAGLGVTLGYISQELRSLITLVGLITIAGSTYMILNSELIYKWSEKLIRLLEFRKEPKEKEVLISATPEVILFGCDKAGSTFLKSLLKLQKDFLVVDYNPEIIKQLKEKNLRFAYGDADDIEFLDEIGINSAKLVVSTIPNLETNKLLVNRLHSNNPKAMSIVLSHRVSDTLELYKLGASYVIMPLYLGAKYASQMIRRNGINSNSFKKERERHLMHLTKKN